MKSTALLLLVLAVVTAAVVRFVGHDSAPPPVDEGPRALPAAAGGRRLVAVEAEEEARGGAVLDVPREWIERNNRATDLLEGGEVSQAVAELRRCLEAAPKSGVFRRNLAESLVRLAQLEHEAGDSVTALASLEEALALVPERTDRDVLERLRARWRDEIDIEGEHWREGSDLFELSYATERSDLLHGSQRVLDHLELAYEDLRQWFGHDPVRSGDRGRIKVVLLDREEFDRLTGLGDWAGGAFDGVVRVSVDDLAGQEAHWKRVLRHELVHAFVHVLGGGRAPGWLNEGLAQLLERRSGHVDKARRIIAGQELFTLAELAGSLIAWDEVEAIARAYAQSLAFVDYLERNHGDEALRRMVRASGEGGDPESAFEDWSAVPLALVAGDFARDVAAAAR